MTIRWIVPALVAILAVAVAVLHETLSRGQNAVDDAWNGVETQLTRRRDMVPRLLAVLRYFAGHECSLFEEAQEACARSLGIDGDVAARGRAENALSAALGGLFAMAGTCPALTDDAGFLRLRHELVAVEDAIQAAGYAYNEAARAQNTRLGRFPGKLVGGLFHFGPVASFPLAHPMAQTLPDTASPLG